MIPCCYIQVLYVKTEIRENLFPAVKSEIRIRENLFPWQSPKLNSKISKSIVG